MKRKLITASVTGCIFLLLSCSNNGDKTAANNTDSNKITNPGTKTSDSATVDTGAQKRDPLRVFHAGGSAAYDLPVPAGWVMEHDTILQGGGRYIKIISPRAPDRHNFSENVTVSTEKLLKPGLDNYYKSGKEGMLRDVPTVQVIAEGDATVSNTPAKWMRVTFAGNYMPYQLLMYIFVKGDVGYTMTFTSDEKNYSKYEQEFKRMAKTFRFTD